MSSRRLISRSYSADGRSSYYNGDTVSGNIRSRSRSYLSSVRQENRSTLCTVMAQLTEETQPSFEITLKSKAVSETCNVKFICVLTGHPDPEVTWYKDDIQLDRYCGLPKYEISKDEQTHSLHIYNCTLEDAAIYQASARNNKGIVSCSGVLEVGTMSEFKIHQQYFSKIKQKAESKRRDSEEPKPWNKENNIPTYQEQRRTISPDRSQRKGRSPTEERFRTSESLEDKGLEQCPRAPGLQQEAQLKKTTMVEKEKPRLDTMGVSTPIPNGEVVEENDRIGLTYIYDSVQKTFNKHQPKTPLAKKPIKNVNGVEKYGVDDLAETVSEEREEMEGAGMIPEPTQSLHAKESQEEFMTVKYAVQSQVSQGATLKEKESDNGCAPLIEDKKQTEQILVVPLLSKEPAIHESSVLTVTECKLTGSNSYVGAELKKTTNESEENKTSLSTEQPILSLEIPPKYTFKTPPQVSDSSPNEADKIQSNNVPITKVHNEPLAQEIKQRTTSSLNETIQVMGDSVAVKPHPNSQICGTTVAVNLESSETTCGGRAGLPQHPCELSSDQLSGEETSPHLKNVSMSQLQLLAEAHVPKNTTAAPVTSESQTTKCEINVKTRQLLSSEGEIATNAKKTPSLHNVVPLAFDDTMQDTRDHSRGSNESHTVLLTDLQKSPLKRLDGSESTSRYNVSSIVQQSQVETAIKSVEGTEIQVDKKAQVNGAGKLQEEGTNAASIRIVDRGTRTAVQQTKTEKPVDTSGTKTFNIVTVEFLDREKEQSKMASANSELSAKRNPAKNALEQQIENVKEKTTPVIKARSAADPMRSQIGTIDKSLTSELPKPLNNSTVEKQNVAEKWDEIKTMHQTEEDKRQNTKLEKGISPISATHADDEIRNANKKLLQSYNIITTIEEEASVLVPPISIVDIDSVLETNCQCANKENNTDTVIYPLLESGSAQSSLKYDPDMCQPSTENAASDFSSPIQKECCNKCSLLSMQSLITASGLTLLTASGEINTSPSPIPILSKECDTEPPILKHGTEKRPSKDIGFKNSLTPTTKLFETKFQKAEINSPANIHQHREQQTVFPKVQTLGHATQCVIRAESEEENGPLIHQDSSESSAKKNGMTTTPLPNPDCNPELRQEDRTSPVPSATPQELAAGARRKVLPPKPKVGDGQATMMAETHTEREDQDTKSSQLSPEGPTMCPSVASRSPSLQPLNGQHNSAVERRSPCLRRKLTPGTQPPPQEPAQLPDISKNREEKAEKDKYNLFKAPQVIRRIRGEPFPDASGHLKLWCQFFNVLSESTVKWYKDEMEIAEVKRSAGHETQVALAIVLASSKDCGVYGCTITNEYGTDSTDILLGVNILAEMFLREDQVVGEEIEMTPLLYNKVLTDTGFWGSKFFGRIMMEGAQIGEGCSHKTCRAKVIYGLEPVFESGTSVVIKVHNPIAYEGKEESNLIKRNLDLTQQDCRYQNIAREYCKIFSAEAKIIENFGTTPEVIPLYLMNRPANAIPNATVEVDLKGEYLKYCFLDTTNRLIMKTKSELEQKCCALQHWIHQWTNGNLLFTRLEGVETKITNVGISVKTTGYHGFAAIGNPIVFEQFVSQHQCNFYCGLLNLRSLKDCLQTPARSKGSRSPLLHRKMAPGSSSPQAPKKITGSPAMSRKAEPQDKSTSAKKSL